MFSIPNNVLRSQLRRTFANTLSDLPVYDFVVDISEVQIFCPRSLDIVIGCVMVRSGLEAVVA
jgi:hypothetical protein